MLHGFLSLIAASVEWALRVEKSRRVGAVGQWVEGVGIVTRELHLRSALSASEGGER